jgi:hypothetical protein
MSLAQLRFMPRLFLVVFVGSVIAGADATASEAGDTTADHSGFACTAKPADPEVYFRIPCVDDAYEAYKAFEKDSPIKIGAGAYHWFNVQRENGDFTYGYPGADGAYFYYLGIDAELDPKVNGLSQIGVHTQVRWRDNSLFRTYFTGRTWLYESYAFGITPVGTFKAGKIRNRIGFDWDNSFWGNVAYFDGYKLDPDWGVSWENRMDLSKQFSMESYAQAFFSEDNVNGSIAGGDAESAPGFDEDSTFVLRLAPKWHFTETLSLGGGITGFVSEIKSDRAITGLKDETVEGYALDVNLAIADFSIFAELLQSFGIRNPTHYASGGPSDESLLFYLGAQYQFGPTLFRTSYSLGEYDDPDGEQDLLVVGADVALTKYLTLILEYVNWTVAPDGGRTVKFEDGFQIALNWNI